RPGAEATRRDEELPRRGDEAGVAVERRRPCEPLAEAGSGWNRVPADEVVEDEAVDARTGAQQKRLETRGLAESGRAVRGMANLGFQAVLRILAADPRVTCERAFLPDGPRSEWPRTLRSLEHDRPVRDFDVVAFSISFEADYVHVLDCLALAGIPLWRSERT